MVKVLRLKANTILVLILLTTCSVKTIHYSAIDAIQENVSPRSSNLPAYELTGCIWVKGQPLLINQDFDFSMAMGLPDIGAAVAAGTRKKGNEEVVKLLQDMPPLALEDRFNEAIKSSLMNPQEKEIKLYGILFGQPDAHLRTILELYDHQENPGRDPLRFIYISDWRPVKGDPSWTHHKGVMIHEFFEDAIPGLIAMWQRYTPEVQESEAVKYTVSGGKAIQRGTGWVIEKKEQRVLLQSMEIPNTILSYPDSVLEIQPIPTQKPSNESH